MKKFFRDILTAQEKGFTKYSQGRVYLFVSFIVFFFTNLLLVYYVLTGTEIEDKDSLIIFSSNIKWALGSFALYVLGGKGIGAYRDGKTDHNPYQNSYSYNDSYDSYNRPYERPPVRTRRTTVEEDVETKNNNTPDHIKNSFYQTGDEEVD